MKILYCLTALAYCFLVLKADNTMASVGACIIAFMCFIACELNDLNNKNE